MPKAKFKTLNMNIKIEIKDEPLDFELYSDTTIDVNGAFGIKEHINQFKIENALPDDKGCDAVSFSSTSWDEIDKELENKTSKEEILFQILRNSKFPIVLVEKFDLRNKEILSAASQQITENFSKKHLANFSGVDHLQPFVAPFEKKRERKETVNASSQEKMVNNLVCTKCSYKSNRKYRLTKHMLVHDDVKLFKCSLCDYETNDKHCFTNHLETHSEKKWYKCALCIFDTNNKFCLKRHLSNHCEKKFKCSKCGYRSNHKGWFFDHLIRHKDMKLLTENSTDENSPSPKCFLCGFEADNQRILTSHLIHHAKTRWMKCSECDYETIDRRSLKRHLLNHSDSKSLKCSNCNYMTNDTSHLKRHKLIHNTSKLFKCADCKYDTNYKGQLRKHLKEKHN